MTTKGPWEPRRLTFRYVVERRTFSDGFASYYALARRNGSVLRFWTRSAAQSHADKLNEIRSKP